MKKIFIIRTAPYEYALMGRTLYQSFNDVAKHLVETHINKNFAHLFKTYTFLKQTNNISVYCSPRKRSIQTAKIACIHPIIMKELSEVKFCMENFIDEENFYSKQDKPLISKARRLFINALINNKLDESFQDVIHRIESVIQTIILEKNSTIVLFSHGFYMKIFESYIRDPYIKQNPRRVLNYFDGSVETFKFCEGFSLEASDKRILFHSYLTP